MERLRAYLDKKKVRPAEFARRCGVQRSAVSQWLSGRRRPDRTNALQIEKVTGGAVPAESWDLPVVA